ncbi:AGR086Cp [Eremothecium gossypii ATCC 10895]|uniref:AGR086Cp n=1 Tax=Eremothecium gossypii (strain ATCC 10895 / CBS 109.51 / FGSC 9923 / NRRL Y-1056) TaxID=284811 RepID=Q74ZX2_EREGS|nr:AGR086Cp [Eremothecium gossypii ATCC 10895]AAS54575.2 AGR086Cp [Eremothecium gossypii ATCC 10895]
MVDIMSSPSKGVNDSQPMFVYQYITDEGFKVPQTDLNLYQLDGSLEHEWIDRGRGELRKIMKTVKGQLTQEIYDLIASDTLSTQKLLECCDKVTPNTVENKYVLLKRRYVAKGGIVIDRKRKDAPVIEPDSLFDMIMSAHLINDHMPWRKVYQHMKGLYANVTRELTNMVTGYCSHCNMDRSVRRFSRYKHYNVHEKLMPLERCHVEVFAPFDDEGVEKIQGKYSHLLYCRDYHSRFIWLLPLEGIAFRYLLPALAQLLCTMIRVPIFLETATLDRQDMFDICEVIARRYKFKIGLGLNSGTEFQKNGIKRVKQLLSEYKEECQDDWNMCLRLVLSRVNQTYADRVRGIPSDLLCNEIPNISMKFKQKQKKIIDQLYAHHVVHFKEAGGMIYLEDEESAFVMDDPDDDCTPVPEEPPVASDSIQNSATILTPITSTQITENEVARQDPDQLEIRPPSQNNESLSDRVSSEEPPVSKERKKRKISKRALKTASSPSPNVNEEYYNNSELAGPGSSFFKNISTSQEPRYGDVSLEL